jgi:hypothetical protein
MAGKVWAVFRKDLLLELRTKDSLNAMLFFGIVVLVVFHFALESTRETIRQAVPGYGISRSALLLGEAERTSPVFAANGRPSFDVPVGAIFPPRTRCSRAAPAVLRLDPLAAGSEGRT